MEKIQNLLFRSSQFSIDDNSAVFNFFSSLKWVDLIFMSYLAECVCSVKELFKVWQETFVSKVLLFKYTLFKMIELAMLLQIMENFGLWKLTSLNMLHVRIPFKFFSFHLVVFIQSLSLVPLSATPWTAAHQAPIHHLPELAEIQVYWGGDAISSFTTPISFWLQSVPDSGSFPMSELFASDGQPIRASASASIFPVNI